MKACQAPSNQLYLHSSGEIYPCSFLQNDSRFVLGHIQNDKLSDVWKSEKLNDIRKIHQELNHDSRCHENQNQYICNSLNDRLFFNHDLSLKRLDVMLDSFCNIECIMCTNIYDKSGGFEGEFFWQNNLDTLSHIKEIELVGGEPLISPHFFRLAEIVLDINPQCEWRFTTNANFQFSDKLLKLLARMNIQNFAISLDSLEKNTFEKIRQRSRFELTFNNILELKKSYPQIMINMVVQKLNYKEIFDFYYWCNNHNLRFYPILLQHPIEHSLLNSSKNDLKKVLEFLMLGNEQTHSPEIFFLIKKLLYNGKLEKDIDLIGLYQNQLEILKAHSKQGEQ